MGYSDGGYDDGYASDPLYGYRSSVTDPATGYTHIQSAYYDASGFYYRGLDEDRGPYFDHSVQTTRTYASGVYTTDVLETSTPLDGAYQTYGTRDTSTYDVNSHTSTTNAVQFSAGYSLSDFHSYNYATGASVASYDARFFYAYGYNEYTVSTYDGPQGHTYSSVGAYHYTG